MNRRVNWVVLALAMGTIAVFSAGCGGGGSNTVAETGTGSGAQTGNVNMMMSDASTEDWATIGVRILSIALIPQGGGSNVTVYTAPSPAPMVNLVELDQLGEILGNVTVPVGTYTGAVVTIGGNPTDIELMSSNDPSAAFLALGTKSTSIPTSQIQVQGTTGTSPNLTVPVTVNFVSNLVVAANQTNALDLEFDLSHPAFLVGHMPTGGGPAIWAINFKGPLHHHPIPDITRFVLRDIYGTVSSVNSDGSLTITKVFPAEPVSTTATAETSVSSTHTITILPDAVNHTIFYDVDAKTNQAITSYSTVSSDLPVGEFVRVTARYQSGGSLVAVRTWASSSFGDIYVSPEGHVLRVNNITDVLTVENEMGLGIPLTVNSSTEFYFRAPWNSVSDATPIGSGTAFLTNLERGFKVHVSVVDPLASPLVAQTVDIEIARYDGTISGANTTGFTYTRNFATAADSYVVTLPFISSTTANGNNPVTGAAIAGFKWWNFTFPTVLNSGSTAVSSFDTATDGGVTFGGTAPPVTASGESYAVWGDPSANPTGWYVPWTVLDPTNLQLGTAATGYVNGSPNGTFTMKVPLGTLAVTIDMSTVSGSGTLVYQVDQTGSVVTVIPVDITTTAGQTTVTNNLLASTPVDVYGVPQADGTVKAYVVFYYTGIKPVAVD